MATDASTKIVSCRCTAIILRNDRSWNIPAVSSRRYEWTYKDCEGNTHVWSKTFNFGYNADFFVPADIEFPVSCLLYAQTPFPFPETLYDICAQEISVSGPTVTESIDASGCSGWRKFAYVYTDCGGHSHPWSFTYYANDNEPPVGNCPNVDVTDLACIEDVPCVGSYDFSSKIQQLLDAGNIYDICSGDDLVAGLDSWTELWQCSDDDGDGVYTFGRTFYFRIADACGNEFPSFCSVTYSGVCQPIVTFTDDDWGIAGGEPGSSTNQTDLQVITTLLNQGPLVVGGGMRSLTLTDAQCVVSLLPGIGTYPSVLSNCHQVNCLGSCNNPAGPEGMKNLLAANTIAMALGMRYTVQYNGVTMNNVRSQGLGCVLIDPNIKFCAEGAGCKLRVFESNGTVHDFPYTIGGLLDLTNLYLGGNLALTGYQSPLYAAALNVSIQNVNAYWHAGVTPTTCNPSGGAYAKAVAPYKPLPTGKPSTKGKANITLAPNPAGNEVAFKMAELGESQKVTFEIYNSLGQLLLRKEFGQVAYVNERIDLSGIVSGLYIVSVKAGQQRFEQKLVISKD